VRILGNSDYLIQIKPNGP